ncbi:MAG: sugar ABC transporter permease [Phycisphaerales bacterium]|nr:sugar ABC transporter permease [Phycisphaerales bacterium]
MNGARWSQRAAPFFFLAPFGLVFLVFTVYPLAHSVVLSLRQTVGTGVDVYIGPRNYGELLRDGVFWGALGRTVYFAALSVLIQLPIALGLALLVHGKGVPLRAIFRTTFFLPVLVGAVFIGVAFKRIYGVQDGVINALLVTLGFTAIDWLRDPAFVMNTLVFTGVWMFAGFNMVYFLAGLQGIPTELYEAATVDGANVWQRFCHVTIPGIWPIAAFLITASTIGSFGLFDLPWVLTDRGGPGRASTTLMVYLYERGFLAGDLGYAAAMGWMITVILLVIALAQLKLSRAWQE